MASESHGQWLYDFLNTVPALLAFAALLQKNYENLVLAAITAIAFLARAQSY